MWFSYSNWLPQVEKNERLELEPIGNHSRGTTFLNGNHFINEKLEAIFDEISNQMKGIHYGRFDMKCASSEAVQNGHFKVLEYNGVAAEPAHIYDPAYPIWKKYRDIYRHWKIIYNIYKIQRLQGIKPDRFADFKKSWAVYSDYMRKYG